ncbi:uncharacterized protein M6B38_178265 [Iris pallida]|uniref:Uncharacterized protein n=1 Tax=Iris pallida TaxID=29817 RepID=A0AAX6ENU5_IRIPA|nr:uncharacterized protein M6B38_178265 [Iris pallida]
MENSRASLIDTSFNKLEKFDGEHFQIWKRKVTLNLQLVDIDHVLIEDEPIISEGGTADGIAAALVKQSKWKRENSICKLLILNSMEDYLAETYFKKVKVKEIWDSLGKLYEDDENKSKIFIVEKYHKWLSEDEMTMLPQVKEFLKLRQKIDDEKMSLVDKFVVGGIVSKLPAGGSNFYARKHQKKLDISLEDLLQEIHIEDEMRSQQKMDSLSKQLAKANLVQTREFKGKQVASHHKKK